VSLFKPVSTQVSDELLDERNVTDPLSIRLIYDQTSSVSDERWKLNLFIAGDTTLLGD